MNVTRKQWLMCFVKLSLTCIPSVNALNQDLGRFANIHEKQQKLNEWMNESINKLYKSQNVQIIKITKTFYENSYK